MEKIAKTIDQKIEKSKITPEEPVDTPKVVKPQKRFTFGLPGISRGKNWVTNF